MYRLINKILFLIFILTIAGCSKSEKIITTPSGLKYVDIVEGTGPTPVKGQEVTFHSTGKLPDGKIFDNTIERNQPYKFKFGAGEVIPGMDEGLLSMKAGGKRRLMIPPDLAYGPSGAGGVVPPNS